MKLKEFIAELLKLDPTGEMTVHTITGDCDELSEVGYSYIYVTGDEDSFSYSHEPTKHCNVKAIQV